MTRRKLLVAASLLGLLVASVLIWVLYPWPGVTDANYELIQEGMAYEKVVAILGGPPTNGILPGPADDEPAFYVSAGRRCPSWESSDGNMSLYLNFSHGRVTSKSIHHVTYPTTFLDRLRRRLR